jgi:hypothetical protein
MGAIPIVSDISGIVSSLFGKSEADKQRELAEALRQRGYDAFNDIQLPDMKAQMLALEELKSTGKLTPELEQAINQGDTALNDVHTDPRLKQAQLDALTGLQDVSDKGGMTLTDTSNLRKVQDDVAATDRGRRGAIMQNLASRGASGSGFELAAQLENAQDSATRESKSGLDVAAQARDRALDALMKGGELAGNVRGEDYSEAAKLAEAKDAISRFNAANRQDVQTRNVNRVNDASKSNLGNDQRIADANVGLRNQAQISNKGLFQQQYDDQLKKAAGASGQLSGMAAAKDTSADRGQAMWSGVGQAIAQGGNAIEKGQNDEEERKRSDKRFDDYLSTFGGKY